MTDSKGSIAMMFAIDEECSVEDLKQRKKGKMAKGLKVPRSLLKAAVVSKIEGIYGCMDLLNCQLCKILPMIINPYLHSWFCEDNSTMFFMSVE